MEIGDKLYCKKDFHYGGNKYSNKENVPIKGRLYDITYFDTHYIRIKSDLNGSGLHNGNIVHSFQSIYFSKTKDLANHTVAFIGEYFHILKEIRKLKLEDINESR